MLPVLIAALGAVALVLAMLALWQSLRAAFGAADTSAVRATLGSVERSALLDEKAALLRSIKDLQFERDVGKLAEPDYQSLDSSLRARAREVLRLLDSDVKPFKGEAEKLVRDHLAKELGGEPYRERARDVATKRCPECSTQNDEDADFCKSCKTRLSPRTCPECSTVNDADAQFCKKCAHDFEGEQRSDDEEPKDEEPKNEPEADEESDHDDSQEETA